MIIIGVAMIDNFEIDFGLGIETSFGLSHTIRCALAAFNAR